jgi:hypothetical protein
VGELDGGAAAEMPDISGAPEAQEAAELASQQTDPERLMDGEDPETEDLEDAHHWLGVYQELHAFKLDLLGKLRGRVQTMSKEDAQGEAQADERLLELELQRFESREHFWRERIAQLKDSAS